MDETNEEASVLLHVDIFWKGAKCLLGVKQCSHWGGKNATQRYQTLL
jgi:hypothetical protein